jgi:anti-sigma B factor antagonist
MPGRLGLPATDLWQLATELTGFGGCVRFLFHTQSEESMKFSSRQVANVVIIDIEGKILLGDGDVEIKQAVDEHLARGRKKVILNLAKVPYIDSAGLGEIIRCYTAIRKSGGDLKLLAPNPRLVDLLGVTKLVNVFDWYSDETSALESFSS